MTVVVFCPNLIGDTVMATPTLRALRERFAGARIVAVVKPTVAPTLAGSPWLDDIIRFRPGSKTPGERTGAVIRAIRRERPELAVLLPNSFRSAMMAWLGGAKRRVGYARGGRSLLLTDRLSPPLDARGKFKITPIVDYYLEIARHLGCKRASTRLELFTTAEEEAAADAAWSNLGLPDDRTVVGLNTGGAFGPAKAWPVEHFAALARRLHDEMGRRVLVLCGPTERDAARAIVEQTDRPGVCSLADQPMSIGLSKASVKRLGLLVTTDSGPRHFAAAFGVPVVSIFGPTHIAWTRTQHPTALHVFHPVPCGPCQKPVCPEGHHRCMRDLSPDAVHAAARKLLS